MEGGDLWNMFKTANRKVLKRAVPVMDVLGGIAPMLLGQPELAPFTVAGAHMGTTLAKNALLPAYGKNKKRVGKLEEKARQVKEEPKPVYYTSPYQTQETKYPETKISTDSNMPVRKYSFESKTRGSGLHAPRSRGGGYDMMSPLAEATLGHSQANSMLGKIESHLSQARQHNQGLVSQRGTLINAIPPLQSAPQQNFQFRHTLLIPAFHPSIFGN